MRWSRHEKATWSWGRRPLGMWHPTGKPYSAVLGVEAGSSKDRGIPVCLGKLQE